MIPLHSSLVRMSTKKGFSCPPHPSHMRVCVPLLAPVGMTKKTCWRLGQLRVVSISSSMVFAAHSLFQPALNLPTTHRAVRLHPLFPSERLRKMQTLKARERNSTKACTELEVYREQTVTATQLNRLIVPLSRYPSSCFSVWPTNQSGPTERQATPDCGNLKCREIVNQ